MDQVNPPSPDERMMSALAHFFGLIAALIIWIFQKDKSGFVRFQAAQALAFDFLVMLFLGILFFCLFGIIFIGIFGAVFATLNSTLSSENFNQLFMFPFLFPFLISMCVFPVSFAILAARVVATISVLSGHNFRYPILAGRVERFLTE